MALVFHEASNVVCFALNSSGGRGRVLALVKATFDVSGMHAQRFIDLVAEDKGDINLKQILIVKTTWVDPFSTEYVAHIRKTFIVCRFRRAPRWLSRLHPFIKWGLPNGAWGACLSVVDATVAAWVLLASPGRRV